MKKNSLVGVLIVTNLITVAIIAIFLVRPKTSPVPSHETSVVNTEAALPESPPPDKPVQTLESRLDLKGILQNLDPLYERVFVNYQTRVRQKPPYWGDELMGYVFAKDGRYEEGIRVCQTAIQYNSKNLDNMFTLAWIYTAMERYADAEKTCNQCLTIDPYFSRAAVLKGWIYFNQGQPEKAMELYQKASQDNPRSPGPLYGMGRLYALKGEYAKAIEAYQSAIHLKPDAAEIYLYLGLACEQAGQALQAREAFRKAIDTNRQYADAYLMMGVSLDKAGLHSEAEKEYQNTVLYQPVFPEARLFSGIYALRTGAYQAASMCFLQAKAMKPDYPEAYVGLGIAYLLMNQTEEARIQQQRLAEINPAMAEEFERIIQKASQQ
jgi:tetratricopeptide (TPR) repeat protein